MTVPADRRLEDALIDHVMDTDYEDLPADGVACCKRLVMDSLGVLIAGHNAPGCTEIIGLMDGWRCDAGASVFLSGLKTAPPLAALANSAMMHALDFDDTLDASALHTFVSVLPAALAAAETRQGVSGRQLIAALVLGVDVICRISLGIRTPLSWIRTATCGGFGAAAAAGKILGLDRCAMANALGIVYSQTAGNAQGLVEGKLVKRMQPGFMASAGVTAALLAQSGITGSREFLSGTYGYYSLYERGDVDPQPVIAALGTHWTITDLSIKPYPSCRMTHSAIDAALDVRSRLNDSWEAIEKIDVRVSKMVREMVGKPFVIGVNPQVDAQFSIPYTVACALIKGDVFLDDIQPDAIADMQVRSLADRVHVSVDPDLAAKDLLPAALRVHLKDGRDLAAANAVPLGNPQKAMDGQRCREKFKKCVRFSKLNFTTEHIDRLLAVIEDLDRAADVRGLVDLMDAQPGTAG